MSTRDPVLQAGDIRATSQHIRSYTKIDDSPFIAPLDISAEQEALAGLLVRRLANRHHCACGKPEHAAGQFHACACASRSHARDVVAAMAVLEALGLRDSSSATRLNDWGVRQGRAKP